MEIGLLTSLGISRLDKFGRFGNSLVPTVDYRSCELLSLSSYDARGSIDEKYRGFVASLGDLVTTHRFLEEVGGHLSRFSHDASTVPKQRKITISIVGGYERSLITRNNEFVRL